MKTVAIEIPEDLLVDFTFPKEEWETELKKELALQLYRDKLMSFVNARRLAGLSRIEFHYLLGERHIPRHYDVEDYRQDVENLQKWEADQQ